MGVGIGASSASVHLEANSAITTVLQNLHGSGTCVYPKIQRGSRGAAIHRCPSKCFTNCTEVGTHWRMYSEM